MGCREPEAQSRIEDLALSINKRQVFGMTRTWQVTENGLGNLCRRGTGDANDTNTAAAGWSGLGGDGIPGRFA
jgi:hypothetical protein